MTPPVSRAEAKAATRRRILDIARSHLATDGAANLSMRRIAGEVGVVPSALYKHVPTRDALLTELIVEAYTRLADHLDRAPLDLRARALALRAWALAHPHEFHLLYGTPVIGYRAPSDTVPAAARVFEAFLDAAPALSQGDVPVPSELARQLEGVASQADLDVARVARTLAQVGQLVGMILLELGGHFVGTVTPADAFYGWVVEAWGAG